MPHPTTIGNKETFLQDFPVILQNSSAKASELLENLEEMYPRYYMHNEVFGRF